MFSIPRLRRALPTLIFCIACTSLASPTVAEPMRVSLVRHAGDCATDCREWISAEGEITKETTAEFAALFRAIGKRTPPIVINSVGGNLTAAEQIGNLIRRRGHDVAVGRTAFTECNPGAACASDFAKAGLPGALIERGVSICASACSLILAAGRERILLSRAVVGVHQMQIRRSETTVTRYRIRYRVVNGRRHELGRERISTRTLPAKRFSPALDGKEYAQLKTYFSRMGVDRSIVDLFHKAPYEGMHWLLEPDLKNTRIMTDRRVASAFIPKSEPTQQSAAAPGAKLSPTLNQIPSPPSPQAVYLPGVLPTDGNNTLAVVGTQDGRPARIDLRFDFAADRSTTQIAASFTFDGKPIPQRRAHFLIELDQGRRVFEETGDLNAPDDAPLLIKIPHNEACRIHSGEPARFNLKIWNPANGTPLNIPIEPQALDPGGKRTHPACAAARLTAQTASVRNAPPRYEPAPRFVQTPRTLLARSIVGLDSYSEPRSRVEISFFSQPTDRVVEGEAFVFLHDVRLRRAAEVEFTHQGSGTILARRPEEAPDFAPLRFWMSREIFCSWRRGSEMTVEVRMLGETQQDTGVAPVVLPRFSLQEEPSGPGC